MNTPRVTSAPNIEDTDCATCGKLLDSEAERRYNALVARLEEIEAEVAAERGMRVTDVYLTDPTIDYENTAGSHDWRTGEPLVEGTDAWWDMMYGQGASAAGDRGEELGIDINSYFPKPIY